jgi:hypothetical protein
MMKHFSLLVALSTTAMLAGCELYYGGGNSDDSWTYCGSDGYYTCQGNDCEWASPTCPDAGSGSPPGGFDCASNSDCAAGCYCANGTCEEAGFCTTDADCGEGYHCEVDRSSCVPDDTGGCLWDNECATGEYCSPDTLTCTATCVCMDDETAVANGYGWCDETRNTCLPGQDPGGTCAGDAASTCTTAAPACPTGQVPTLLDGCYTGQCRDYAQCDINPVCSHINDEPNCQGRAADCVTLYIGIDCQKPDGTPCQSGDSNCTCASFQFGRCADRTATPREVLVRDQYGHLIDASQLILQ